MFMERCLWLEIKPTLLFAAPPAPATQTHARGTGKVGPAVGRTRVCSEDWCGGGGGELQPHRADGIGAQGAVGSPGAPASFPDGETEARRRGGTCPRPPVTKRAGKRGQVLLVPNLPTLLLFTLCWG